MNKIHRPPVAAPDPGAAQDRTEPLQPASPEPADSRAAAIGADLGELILLIGRIRRELDGGDPLHCPDMKPLARRVERILGLLPQLPRPDAQPLLPRLERAMAELDSVEALLRQRKTVLDEALDAKQAQRQPDPGLPRTAPGGRHRP